MGFTNQEIAFLDAISKFVCNSYWFSHQTYTPFQNEIPWEMYSFQKNNQDNYKWEKMQMASKGQIKSLMKYHHDLLGNQPMTNYCMLIPCVVSWAFQSQTSNGKPRWNTKCL